MEYVVDLNNQKFKALGLQLGLLQPTLDKLTDATCPAEYGQAVMQKWLERVDNVMERGVPTWSTLANALMKKTVGCRVQGDQILKDLQEGKL